MKKILTPFSLFFWFILPNYLLAQTSEERIPLAVLPFVASRGAVISNLGNLNTIQEAVTKEFSSKSRFKMLDRSKFETIVQELNIQKSEEFLNSEIVEQGKALSAQYLVAGVVNELKVSKLDKKVPKDITKPFGEKTIVTSYQASLRMAFAVINVETQELVYNQPMNVATKDYFDGDTTSSITHVIEEMQKEVRKEIRNLFSVQMKILGIDKVDKNGLPETVLINGGGSMFVGKDAKNLRLGVYVYITVGDLKREKQVGEIKLLKVEGDVVVCQVKDGEKEIDNGIKSNETLIVKIIPGK